MSMVRSRIKKRFMLLLLFHNFNVFLYLQIQRNVLLLQVVYLIKFLRSLVTLVIAFIVSVNIRPHFHAEIENASMTNPLRNYSNRTLTFLNNLLDDCETQSNSFMIHFSSSVQFTEAIKQFWYVFRRDTCPCVFDLNLQKMRLGIIISFYINRTSSYKLCRIFNDI